MFFLISAALACGPYGALDVFQPTPELQVTVMAGEVSVWNADQGTWFFGELQSATVRRVEAKGDRLYVYGDQGLEILDLRNLEQT